MSESNDTYEGCSILLFWVFTQRKTYLAQATERRAMIGTTGFRQRKTYHAQATERRYDRDSWFRTKESVLCILKTAICKGIRQDKMCSSKMCC